jgi:probable F420-dependent oxidoreductase
MFVDVNIGGSIDGTGGASIEMVAHQVSVAEQSGCDGVWSTEVSRDPFLPLMVAADRSSTLRLGTAVAVAFARSPMTTAAVANDLNVYSRGRFMLGLGSQIQAHIERRFSMPWSAPVQRMREYLAALHAIWHSWESGDKLDFYGEHYRHTLMTPMFRPEPHHFGPPRVLLAAVGPGMTRVAAEAADGILVHGFTTARYLDEVTLATVKAGLASTGRTRSEFTVVYPGLLATGPDDRALTLAVQHVRGQIAFYGATPAYRKVLELHGWDDLHHELYRLAKSGQWQTMPTLIDDTVLNTFAVVGRPSEAGREVARRFAGLVDRFTLYTPYPLDDESRTAVVGAIKATGEHPPMGQSLSSLR